MRHKGSIVLRGAMNIGLASRGTWSDFFEKTNESMRTGHENEAKHGSKDYIAGACRVYGEKGWCWRYPKGI